MKEKHHKHKHKSKHKKDKKSSKKSHKHAKHRRGSSSSSDSDAAGANVQSQLERERAGVQASRHLLAKYPAVKKDFRELLWRLDNGSAVSVAGVPDPDIKAALEALMPLLGLKKAQEQYFLPSGAPPTLSIVGFVFDEVIKPLPAQQPPQAASQQQQRQQQDHEDQAPQAGLPGQQPAAKGPERGPQAPAEGPVEGAGSEEEEPSEQQHPPGHGGPEMTAQHRAQQEEEGGEGLHEDGQQEKKVAAAEAGAGDASGGSGAAGTGRRVVGPAMPPSELLVAAAAYHEGIAAAGGYDAVFGAQEEEEVMVGPPPPTLVEEVDAAPQDEREAEVLRVLKVLSNAVAAASSKAGPAPPVSAAADPALAAEPDPYEVLGVEPEAASGDVRKRYWRLSLLVHPDKCSHSGAQAAFQAVSKAAGILGDAAKRKKVDEQREEAELWKMAQAAAAAEERARAWRVARGEESPGAAAAAAAALLPQQRESWMTTLPAERKLTGQGPPQRSVTAFSKLGVKERGDTSSWTDTPQQKAMRAAGLLPAAGDGPLALTAGSGGQSGPGGPGQVLAPEVAAALQEYSKAAGRKKTLLEQHVERQQKGKDSNRKESKKRDREEGKSKKEKGEKRPKEEWEGKHPWKPFDREKDLAVGPAPRSSKDLLKQAGALSSRFSAGGH